MIFLVDDIVKSPTMRPFSLNHVSIYITHASFLKLGPDIAAPEPPLAFPTNGSASIARYIEVISLGAWKLSMSFSTSAVEFNGGSGGLPSQHWNLQCLKSWVSLPIPLEILSRVRNLPQSAVDIVAHPL